MTDPEDEDAAKDIKEQREQWEEQNNADKVFESSNSQQKTTVVEFKNPEHSDVSAREAFNTKEMFVAALWLKEQIGTDRPNLYGTFALAVKDVEEQNNWEQMFMLLDRLDTKETDVLEKLAEARRSVQSDTSE